jgi:hypothetical protein
MHRRTAKCREDCEVRLGQEVQAIGREEKRREVSNVQDDKLSWKEGHEEEAEDETRQGSQNQAAENQESIPAAHCEVKKWSATLRHHHDLVGTRNRVK